MEKINRLFEASVKQYWDSPALSDFRVSTENYSVLATKIAKLHLLWEKAGLLPSDKVAINAKSSSHWAEVFLAAVSGGYVSVQLYNAFLPADTQSLVNHSDSRILYTEKNNFSAMDFDAMPALVAAIDIDSMEILASRGDFSEIYAGLDLLFAERYPQGFTVADVNYDRFGMDDVCAIMYTSGSTGSPKGVMLTIRNFSWNVERFSELAPYGRGENYVSILPYSHIFGLTCDLVTPMCLGMHVVILCKMPVPVNVEAIMQEYKPKIFFAVPLVLNKFVEYTVGSEIHSAEGKAKLDAYEQHPEYSAMLRDRILNALGGNIKVFVTGGAAIAPEIESLLAFKLRLPFITGYGMSECAPLLAIGKLGSYKARSCGECIYDLDVRIDSPDEKNCPGEFQLKGPCVFSGYYNNPEATAACFTEDGYFRTGDIGVIDDDRTLFLMGRCKNMLLSANGQNIYPEEIETLLNGLAYVAESVVVQRGSQLHAIIVPDMQKAETAGIDGGSFQSIMAANIEILNRRLPAYEAVNSFELRLEPFSKTPKGSIRRFLYS